MNKKMNCLTSFMQIRISNLPALTQIHHEIWSNSLFRRKKTQRIYCKTDLDCTVKIEVRIVSHRYCKFPSVSLQFNSLFVRAAHD